MIGDVYYMGIEDIDCDIQEAFVTEVANNLEDCVIVLHLN